ncbi:MAG: tetratricopeptide repeat protein [Acidobacteria bacterium]|nr:tetratricopeptide repeat protein [Acidobacteriota bacterium]
MRRERGRALLARGSRAIHDGRYRKAASALEQAVRAYETADGSSHPELAAPLTQLALAYRHLGRFVDAGMAYQRALHILQAAGEGESVEAADVFHNLGALEYAAGNWLRGEPYAREAVRIRTRLLGRDHPAVASDLAALAALLQKQQKLAEAERLSTRALAVLEREYGPEHHLVAVALTHLAGVRHQRGAKAEAERLCRRALEIEEAQLGPTHPKIASTLDALAAVLRDSRRADEADVLLRRATRLLVREVGPRHPHVAACLYNHASVLKKLGQKDAAARLIRKATRIRSTVDAMNDEGVAVTGTINPLYANYRLSAKRSDIHRLGVFAEDAIPKGRKVIEYTGERITAKESGRRWNPKRSYLFELTTRVHLDGAIGGSGAEYINHSCDPNLKTRIVRKHILYYSVKDIAPGDELTVDYHYDHDTDRMPCHCGAPTCRGTLNLPPPEKKRKSRT